MENSIKDKCPFKIDIGPVYSVDPAKRHAYAQSGDNVFTPVERELVFDIVSKPNSKLSGCTQLKFNDLLIIWCCFDF